MRKKHSNNKARFFISSSLIGLVVAVWCCQLAAIPARPRFFRSFRPSTSTELNIKDIDQKVLNLAITAYKNAKKFGYGISNQYLTIVDYSLPSTEQRLWVIDMDNNKVLHHTHVAHGSGSGDNYARKFSNIHGSSMSSLGVYVTGEMYNGKHGTSMRLHGIDGKFNSNALSRGIVVHSAHYVNERVIKQIRRLGRSLGCLALNTKVANKIMHTIKNGSVVFCYYPDPTWLKSSEMLQG